MTIVARRTAGCPRPDLIIVMRARELLAVSIATACVCASVSAQTVRRVSWVRLSGAPSAIVSDERGSVYVAEYANGTSRIHRATSVKQEVIAERFLGPVALALDTEGSLYVASETSGDVHRVEANGDIRTIASGFERPSALTIANGLVYVANAANGTISRIHDDGRVSVHASGLRDPAGLAAGRDGSLFVASGEDGTISRIDASGRVESVAAVPNGSRARLRHLTVADDGTLYAASRGHQVVYAIERGNVRVHAGSGIAGHADGTASGARFHMPTAVAMNGNGRVLVSEYDVPGLRLIDPRDDDTVHPQTDDGDLPLVDTARVRLDSVSYLLLTVVGDRTDSIGVVRVTSARIGGRLGRVVQWDTRTGNGSDSTIVAAANLRLIASSRAETAYPLSMLDVVIASLPLRHGYSTVMPLWSPRFGLARGELRVRGLETGAGRSSPLWIVDVALPDATVTIWLEYTSRRAMRMRHDFGRGSALLLVTGGAGDP